MNAKKCPACGLVHAGKCANDARAKDDPRTGYPLMPRHGHTIHDNQPRVRHQISRQMKGKCP